MRAQLLSVQDTLGIANPGWPFFKRDCETALGDMEVDGVEEGDNACHSVSSTLQELSAAIHNATSCVRSKG